MPRVEVLGVYPVAEAPETCHLVEVVVRESRGFDVGAFTQEWPGRPRDDWQVPWDEHLLDADGMRVIADDLELRRSPTLLHGDVRLVFFLHDLDPTRPLSTPFGEVEVPTPMARPGRLEWIAYEPPC